MREKVDTFAESTPSTGIPFDNFASKYFDRGCFLPPLVVPFFLFCISFVIHSVMSLVVTVLA